MMMTLMDMWRKTIEVILNVMGMKTSVLTSVLIWIVLLFGSGDPVSAGTSDIVSGSSTDMVSGSSSDAVSSGTSSIPPFRRTQ